MMMWLCILFSTALLAVATYGAMKWFGQYSLKRDEAERARLAEEWKRRAAERKARLEGGAPVGTDEPDLPPPSIG